MTNYMSVIFKLEDKGYDLVYDHEKNILMMIDDNPIKFTFSINNILMMCVTTHSEDEVVEMISNLYEDFCQINRDMDEQFIKDNILLGIRQKTKKEPDKIQKETDYNGLEQYMYIRGVANYGFMLTIEITKPILNHLNISEEKAWTYAKNNNNENTEIIACDKTSDGETIPTYIVTNKIHNRGAAAILNKEAINKELKNQEDKEWTAIMPSIHRVILIPKRSDSTTEILRKVIKESENEDVLTEKDKLTNRTYTLQM